MKGIIGLLFVLSFVCACTQERMDVPGGVDPDDEEVELSHGMIVLGDKLEDPYTVENMTKALMSVYPTKAGEIRIAPTDLYVRFLPKNQEEYDILEVCCPDMLDHPVDFQIKREGDYYHDPDIPEGDITWQYAVIEKDFVFPAGIKYEILDRCYIAEHDVVTRFGDGGIDWGEVERESFRLTGNGNLLASGTKGSDHPSGRITVLDELYDSDPIGVKGVTVSCNVFVKFAHAFTDEEGYYEMSKTFAGNPRYRLLFKNVKGFGIGVNLILVPASFSTLGKDSPTGVSCQIDKYSNRALFSRSVVNNAVYDYFDSCQSGGEMMETPPSNLRLWLFQNLDASSAVMLQQGDRGGRVSDRGLPRGVCPSGQDVSARHHSRVEGRGGLCRHLWERRARAGSRQPLYGSRKPVLEQTHQIYTHIVRDVRRGYVRSWDGRRPRLLRGRGNVGLLPSDQGIQGQIS